MAKLPLTPTWLLRNIVRTGSLASISSAYYCAYRNNTGLRTVFARNFIYALNQLSLDPASQNWRSCIRHEDEASCADDDLCPDWTLWRHRNTIYKVGRSDAGRIYPICS